MIPLLGRTTATNWTPPSTDVWRIGAPDDATLADRAVLVDPTVGAPPGAGLYVSFDQTPGPGPTIHVSADLHHLGLGDVIIVAEDGSRLGVAWKASARHNSILLTERCEHYCLMCSQPPKERDDAYLYERAMRVVSAMPPAAAALSLTGGEPTIDPERFLALLGHISEVRPTLSTHILSNGRRFADPRFTARYVDAGPTDVMVGIPLYAAEPALHDYVVQSEGAFDLTISGILNLVRAGAAVELRVVVQRANVDVLDELARFIARNLPFVHHVALMGLEMTGLARPNSDLVWVDPHDYRAELGRAFHLLSSAGVSTRIYNHQLCLIDRELWPAAIQSISDWKNDYPDLCDPCVVKDRCTGVFTTSGSRLSPHLEPILSLTEVETSRVP